MADAIYTIGQGEGIKGTKPLPPVNDKERGKRGERELKLFVWHSKTALRTTRSAVCGSFVQSNPV